MDKLGMFQVKDCAGSRHNHSKPVRHNWVWGWVCWESKSWLARAQSNKNNGSGRQLRRYDKHEY